MQRIDHSTAVGVLPAPGSPGTPGFFSEGVPGSQAATVVTGAWLNGVQEEIVGAIEAAGLTPDKEDNTQLAQAIEAIATGVGGTVSTVNVSASTTLSPGLRKLVFVDASGGNLTITLPEAAALSGRAQEFTFARLDSSSYVVTIQRAGSDTIEGVSSVTLAPDDRLTLLADGVGEWLQSSAPKTGRILASVAWSVALGVVTVHRAFNVSGVVRNTVGDYSIAFSSALPTDKYVAAGLAFPGFYYLQSLPTVTSCRVLLANNFLASYVDPTYAGIAIIG